MRSCAIDAPPTPWTHGESLIPEQTINEVRERIDIVALVGRYVDLKKAGTIYKGLCPFHDEKTPSFTVSPTRQTYHCFGCGVHGDCFRFLVESQRRTFPEAVRELAGQAGVDVPEERQVSPAVKAERQRQKDTARRLLDLQDKLCAYYTNQLFGERGRPAQRYLMERGLDRRAAEAFRLGYASGDKIPFQRWVEENEVDRDDLVALGVLVRPEEGWTVGQRLWGGYLRFRERVMFPVIDLRGEVTGFSGRILDSEKKAAKYVNSPETPVFTKGEQLYGAYTARTAARRAGRVVLVEGNVDVVMLWQAGLEGTVAPMGTAITDTQVRLVRRLAERVVCVMDGDAAGQKAAFASLEPFLIEGVQPRAVMLPEGDDPDSFVRREGAEAFEAELDAAPPLLDLFIEKVAESHPVDPQGQAAALREIAPALSLLDDALALELYRSTVQKRLDVPQALVDRALDEAVEQRQSDRRRSAERRRNAERRSPDVGEPSRPGPASFDGPPPEAFPPPMEPFGMPPVDLLPGPPPPDAEFGPPMGIDPFGAERRPLFTATAPGDTPPARTLRVPGYVRKLFEFVVQYPELIDRLDSRVNELDQKGYRLLTHDGLTVFVHNLHREVSRTPTPNLDRLLSELDQLGHRETVAFLRACQACRPDQTRETIAKAFAEALARCEYHCWKSELNRLQEALRTALKSDPDRGRALNLEVRALKDRVKELDRRIAEGAH